MALLRYSFGVDQGADITLPFAFGQLDPSGDPLLTTYPYNFTGAIIRLQVRQALDPASYQYLALSIGSGITLATIQIQNSTAVPSGPNGFNVTITAAQTLTLPNNAALYYDCLITQSSVTTCYLSGTITVGTTVTR